MHSGFKIEIEAVLANYSIVLNGINGSVLYPIKNPIGRGNNIVSGDVYVIQGQSNAVAKMYDGSSSDFKNEFIRVYANGTNDTSSLLENDKWFEGDGDVPIYTNGNTGQWGLKFAYNIIQNEKIPVAIFNGARGAKPISYFDKSFKEENQSLNNYERLLYRLNETNLRNAVKAVVWSQGESDANTSILNYYNSFKRLRSQWKADLNSLQYFYIFQSKSECGDGDLMLVKEAQRKLASDHKDIRIIQTASLKYAPPLSASIDCHFSFKGGYEEFGNRLYQLVKRDIYGIGCLFK